MTSSPSLRVSEREVTMHRLVSPSARIFSAAVILITGMGISAIFWKMPTGNEIHALYHEGIVDQSLAVTPLPSESIAALPPEKRGQMVLPTLDTTPTMDDGMGKYTQVYAPPVALVAWNSDPSKTDTMKTDTTAVEEEQVLMPIVPQKFEPMRPIIDENPISVEPVNRDFQPKPVSVSTVEKSDEMLSMFHFAENSKTNSEFLSEPESPTDPFATVASAPTLQPLQPLQLDGLSPLLPLQNADLQSLSALMTQ